jgi:hypothetical protein
MPGEDPDERYQTIKDVAIELKHVRREMKDAETLSAAYSDSSRSATTASGVAASAQSRKLDQRDFAALDFTTCIRRPRSRRQTGTREVIAVRRFDIGVGCFGVWCL